MRAITLTYALLTFVVFWAIPSFVFLFAHKPAIPRRSFSSRSMNATIEAATSILRSKGVRFVVDLVNELPKTNWWSPRVDLQPFIMNPALEKDESVRRVFRNIQERVLALFASASANTSTPPTVPGGVHVFSVAEFPLFHDLPMVHFAMRAQLVQNSGTCFGAASILTQYAAIWHTRLAIGENRSDHGLLNFGLFIVDHFSIRELEDYVLNDIGIPSVDFLKRILEPRSIVFASRQSHYKSDIEQYGPGLVSGFEVYEDFLNETVHHHDGLPSGGSVTLHAMVLHAVTTDGAGNHVYLLQNW